MPNLLLDIIGEILSRLPVKSLLRFRCVSQDWRCLISDSFFKTLYNNLSTEKNPSSLVITDRTNFYTVEDNSCHKLDIPFLNSTELLGNWWREIKVLGLCNGLLCFSFSDANGGYQYRDCIYLLNPATRELKKLPHIPFEIFRYHSPRVGFGFDPMSKDYKVVMIVYYDDYRTEFMIIQSNVWVYSSNSDNWRKLGDDIPVAELDVQDSRTATVINAAIHWMLYTSCSIFSFDLVHEVFRELPQPPGNSGNSCYRHMAVMGRCLTVFFKHYKQNYSLIEMWVMKEYGVKESWTKQHIIVNYFGWEFKPIEFRNNEILFWHHDNKLVLYNSRSKTERNPGIHGLPITTFKAYSHNESLVTLKGLPTSSMVIGQKGKEED
ncbi:F-box protein At3g07870-like [Telopea speciosissima]|uniref:F-box protein At3g07870-like n=1 Tax=Telopea speciosissima TaxID=54955 RepID=UPI001CC5BFA5|nr:F-box protein At3g07870-like [Telopea speciosissima]